MEAVILVGIQAAGKSTFYRERFATHVRVSLDLLRTRHREHSLLAWCLGHGQRMEWPHRDEGFDERHYVRVNPAGGFLVAPGADA
jgi:hypothetical protein